MDDLLPAEFRDCQEMDAAANTLVEIALVVGDAVGGMPGWMEHHREVGECGHGRQITRQRHVIRLVIEIITLPPANTPEVLGHDRLAQITNVMDGMSPQCRRGLRDLLR